MAKTQKSYRLGRRNPRYTTKLNTFANGMYLTNQIIPEGYAKVMVNYDIDDTGSHIKPRWGRESIQVLDYTSPELGPAHLTDYVYAYNADKTIVEDIKDIVLSYGRYTSLIDLSPTMAGVTYKRSIYISKMDAHEDNTFYNKVNDEWIVIEQGTQRDYTLAEFWGLYYYKDTEQFKDMVNRDVGYVCARTISHAYAFDKPFKAPVGRPIGTVLNNEIITFGNQDFKYYAYTRNPERNYFENFRNPELMKIIVRNDGNNSYRIERQPIQTKRLNIIEAGYNGFNMLSDSPYDGFYDEFGGALSVLGMLAYKQNTNQPRFSPSVGETISLRISYACPNTGQTIKAKIEIADGSASSPTFEVLENFTHTFVSATDTPHYYDLVAKYKTTLVRVTLRLGDDSTTDDSGIYWITCDNEYYANVNAGNFDLSTCTGMFNWQGCVGVYGVESAKDTLFFSDVENPGYFPYPNNIMQFDNEVLAVHNYLDHLLVVTVDSVWLITMGNSIITSNQKRILANLHIPEIDAYNLVVLKDQIFFKTDTQFYVLKPNQYTSDSTDLKNYINSTAIANLTNNFTESVIMMLNETYKPIWQKYTKEKKAQIRFTDFDVLDTRSIIRNEEVHYIYSITPHLNAIEIPDRYNLEEYDNDEYIHEVDIPDIIDDIVLENLNLHFVYNTLTRSWRMYMCVTGNDFVYFNPIIYKDKQSGSFYEFFPFSYPNTDSSKLIVAKQTYDWVTDQLEVPGWKLTNSYDNYNYIDTGNIAIDDAFTKRFREVQFNIMDMEHTSIRMFADFKLDGHERVSATRYILQHITDVEDPDYGQVWITPVEETNVTIYGDSVLADNTENLDYWDIDLSRFPDLNVATVRFNLMGRGRRGSLQLLNTSLKRYQLSDLNWVYRVMSAR